MQLVEDLGMYLGVPTVWVNLKRRFWLLSRIGLWQKFKVGSKVSYPKLAGRF